MRSFYKQLQHETGFFSTVQPIGRSVVKQGDVFRPLYQSIEIIGIDRIFVFDGGHAESFPEVIGNKGRISS